MMSCVSFVTWVLCTILLVYSLECLPSVPLVVCVPSLQWVVCLSTDLYCVCALHSVFYDISAIHFVCCLGCVLPMCHLVGRQPHGLILCHLSYVYPVYCVVCVVSVPKSLCELSISMVCVTTVHVLSVCWSHCMYFFWIAFYAVLPVCCLCVVGLKCCPYADWSILCYCLQFPCNVLCAVYVLSCRPSVSWVLCVPSVRCFVVC